MSEKKYEYGMIGLGTMGRNLLLNMSDHGYSVVGFDKNTKQTDLLKKEAGARNILSAGDLQEFVNALTSPRAIILLVPAGKIVDDVINELKPLLSENDLIMDCGNSHFTDTNTRVVQLERSGIHFMGIGISGGEDGARNGPSIMPGGPPGIYKRVEHMLTAISAKADKKPCVTWLGPGSAGHYVKMVHNGIEYGLMQLISEIFNVLKLTRAMSNEELHEVFFKWNQGMLHSFLIEITADILIKKDELTSNFLVDMILDNAHQNGTGAWTSEDAMQLQVPIPVIDIAVSMRDLSAYKKERKEGKEKLKGPGNESVYDTVELTSWAERALYFAMITTYAQGFALLYTASIKYKYDLRLENIAAIWRGGCIIRAGMLDEFCKIFSKQPNLSNLIFDDEVAEKLMQSQLEIRKIVQIGTEAGIPIPALMGSLAYYDSYRSAWLPANLIQAQRDYFGAHTYERNDRSGTFHTQWEQKENQDGTKS